MIDENKFGWGYVFLGVLLSAVGICFISFSNAIDILAISIGIVLALFGIVFAVSVLARFERNVLFALKIILAIFCITGGIVTAIVRETTVEVISQIFCLLLIIDGSFKLQTSILSKRYKVIGWWAMLIFSILIIVSSFLLSKLAPTEDGLNTVFLGIIFVIDGIANLFSSVYIWRYNAKREDAEELFSIEEKKKAQTTMESLSINNKDEA